MIQANKGQVISKFHKTSMEIRYMELKYFLGVFNRMSAISGLLAGFASSAMMLSVPRWEDPWLVVAFLIFNGSAFGMNLLVILIATLCCLWGPGRALRGNEPGYLHETIDILEHKQQVAMRFFMMGIFSYFVSAIMVTWVFFDSLGALLATALVTAFLFVVVRQSIMIRSTFLTAQPYTTTGFIHGNPVAPVNRF